VLALVCAALLTRTMRDFALRQKLLDVPNERSSHNISTPRGGGLSIVIVSLAGVCALALLGQMEVCALVAILGGGLMVAGIGYLDDRKSMLPSLRFGVHVLSAIWTLVWLGGMPPLNLGVAVWEWGVLGHLVGVVGVVWLINLYNFMDGIDGLAASEAVCVGLMAGGLLLAGGAGGLAWLVWLFAAACGGFLLWNWPPAKIFMGDAGSGFLGYMFAVFALLAARANVVNLWVWVILLGVFVVDATLTLLRRLLRGARWYEAHRSHAYQHATRRLRSHFKVTGAVVLVDLLWLSPWAVAAWTYPAFSLPAVVIALLPVLAVAFALRAGVEQG
jgi:Fuc2NAc and GlcNAc transferase